MLWEAQFLQSLQTIRTPFLDKLMEYASMLGDHGIFCICLGLFLLIFKKTRKTGIKVLIAMLLAYIVANLIIKNAVGRVRPYDAYPYLEALVTKPHDASFPSGHAVNVFAAATAIFLCHKKTGAIALLIAALVAFSRLYNCVHYPTDVLVGIAIGVIFALLVHYLIFPALEKWFRRMREKKKA